jgi:hypothetical protein
MEGGEIETNEGTKKENLTVWEVRERWLQLLDESGAGDPGGGQGGSLCAPPRQNNYTLLTASWILVITGRSLIMAARVSPQFFCFLFLFFVTELSNAVLKAPVSYSAPHCFSVLLVCATYTLVADGFQSTYIYIYIYVCVCVYIYSSKTITAVMKEMRQLGRPRREIRTSTAYSSLID